MTEDMSVGERMVDELLQAGQVASAEEIPDLVAQQANRIGMTDTVIYLVDLQQVRLLPAPGTLVPAREPLVIDATLAGLTFRTLTMLDTEAGGRRRVWLPLLNGRERLGVLEVTVDELDEVTQARCRTLASLAAGFIVGKRGHSDTFAKLARTREMNLAAEIQNALLPSSTAATERVVTGGVIEPAYEVGGDVFDVALDGDAAHMAVIDGVGHDVQSGLISSVAVGAFRNSRRTDADLSGTAAAVNVAVENEFAAGRFATAVLARLNPATGTLSWVNFGHPRPLIIRAGKIVKVLDVPSGLPLGLGFPTPETGEEALEPGDRVLFYTDGVVEARSPGGEPFGEERLGDFIVRASAAGLTLPETLRRLVHALLEHQDGRLQDDATILVVDWQGPGPAKT